MEIKGISKKDAIWAYSKLPTEKQLKLVEMFGSKIFNRKKIEDLKSEQDLLDFHGLDRSYIPFANPTSDMEQSINATTWLMLVTDAYNEGWEPNWKDTREYKWMAYLYFSGGSWSVRCCWSSFHHSPSGLYFKSEALLKMALKTFPKFFEQYWMHKGTYKLA